MSGQTGKLVAGFVVLHVLCCGLPLLIAAGAFTGFGAALGNGTWVAVGIVALAVAVLGWTRRARRSNDVECCAPAASAKRLIESGRR
jgi:hypothetical protein